MSREYSLGFSAATVGATTLNCIAAATTAGSNIEILRHWIGQTANATSAQQRVDLCTQVAVFPTLVGATPKKLKFQDPISQWTSTTVVAALAAGGNVTTEGTGTKSIIWEDAFNVLNGYLKVNTPAETEVLCGNSTLTSLNLWFPAAPTTTTAWSWGWNFREV